MAVEAQDYRGSLARYVPLDGVEAELEVWWALNEDMGWRGAGLYYLTWLNAIDWAIARLIQGIWNGSRLKQSESDAIRSYLLSMRDDVRTRFDTVRLQGAFPLVGELDTHYILSEKYGFWPDPNDPLFSGDPRFRPWGSAP